MISGSRNQKLQGIIAKLIKKCPLFFRYIIYIFKKDYISYWWLGPEDCVITHSSAGIRHRECHLRTRRELWHSHGTMFSNTGETETTSSIAKYITVIRKWLPSQATFASPSCIFWVHVTSSGQWNENKSRVCTTSGPSVKYSILLLSFPSEVIREAHTEHDSIIRSK